MTAGIVVVDKPAGWTSHDVVAKTRGIAGTRKVGHAGTLDPMATGVLVLGVGRATRLLGHLSAADKEYLGTIRLGEATVTDDAEGDLVAASPARHLDPAAVELAMAAFRGPIDQVPSAVSAVKIDGRRAYARVRAGEDVELPARPVLISVFELLDLRHDGDRVDVDVRVVCSSGTYVRALARDLGRDLGVGGHLTALRRTRVGGFTLERARSLDELAASFDPVPLGEAARSSFPVVEVTGEDEHRVRHGRAISGEAPGDPVAVVAADGTFLALYRPSGPLLTPVAVFT